MLMRVLTALDNVDALEDVDADSLSRCDGCEFSRGVPVPMLFLLLKLSVGLTSTLLPPFVSFLKKLLIISPAKEKIRNLTRPGV